MKETAPGVNSEQIIERFYYGDIVRNIQRWEKSEYLNDDLNIDNAISVLADSFIIQNCQSMRYVEYMGAKWKIKSAEILYPRISLYIGGIYNEQHSECDS